MKDTPLDPEMLRIAGRLWSQPQQVVPARGGLFNRVLQVDTAEGRHFLKRFTDTVGDAGVAFPPLPTRASQRCLVACAWHDLALRACDPAMPSSVRVPALVAIEAGLDLVAMEAAAGAPLQPLLQAGPDGARAADRLLPPLARWLAALHTLPLQPRAALLAASRPFKAYKVDLQYVRLLEALPERLRPRARRFIDRYLATEQEPVHGDLNSRNLLVDGDTPWAIDFEQGHVGAGLYDLACLASEYAIQALALHADPLAPAALAWRHYAGARRLDDPPAQWRDLQVHLAFQVLYRLLGPSRQVWTGHLDEAAGRRVRDWSLTALEMVL